MSEKGTDILEFIRELRKLCTNISSLLGTTDNLLKQDGWEPIDSKVLTETSSAYHSPQKWFPSEFFRFYKNERYKHLLTFVCIILDYIPEYTNYTNFNLTEPIISAGWFDYGKDNEVGDNYKPKPWYARYHGWMTDRKDDGTLFHSSKDKQPFPVPWNTVTTFGWPLINITNTEELKSKITDPLLNHIKKANPSE